ncbi:hypothetical protein BDR05DRAFT_998758 [Suillus weaverae]|nr:hypothetical protein BDR05DRAFT_998758 [Suillus weaverae]
MHGHRRQNTKIPQVEAIPAAPAPMPIAPTPVPMPVAPAPAPVAPAAAATSTAATDHTVTCPDDGEWIDIDNVSSGEDNNDQPEIIANAPAHQNPLQTTTSTLPTNPFSMRKRGMKTTSDVLFFFRKNSDTGECICVPCEDSNKINSSCPLTIYGSSMSNTPLHSHIYKFHINLYLQESEKQQWPIGIHAVGDCLNEGWTFTQMWE